MEPAAKVCGTIPGRRTIRAVEKAKAETAERQKYTLRLLEGLYGLAGMEDTARSLRLPEPPPSDAADGDTARPTGETTATERAGSGRTTQTAAPGPIREDRQVDESAQAPREAADEPWDAVDLHGSGRAHENPRDDLPGRGRSGETTRPEAVPDSEEIRAVADPPMQDETESLDGTDPKVWNVFKLLKTIPHRVRNAENQAKSPIPGRRLPDARVGSWGTVTYPSSWRS